MQSARIQQVSGRTRSTGVNRPGFRRPQSGLIAAAVIVSAVVVSAQSQSAAPRNRVGSATTTATAATTPTAAGVIVPPPGYVIGAEDVLAVMFWREKEMSADVTVRPDGKITLPLINDIEAAGLTPDELRDRVNKVASQYIEDPNATVLIKAINSRKVFITGQVAKPGAYPLGGPTTVLQLIALAGGVAEYSDSENISIMRTENGRSKAIPFNYKDVKKRKNLAQNIELKPGDTIVVP